MESIVRVLLLGAAAVLVQGCASMRGGSAEDFTPPDEVAAAAAAAEEPTEIPPRVIDPQVERREVKVARIEAEAATDVRTASTARDPQLIMDAQRPAVAALEELTDITSNSISGKDKIIASRAVDAIKDFIVGYLAVKNRADERWFKIGEGIRDNPDFVAMDPESLRELGVVTDVRHYRDPELPALAAVADAVVVYRVPATEEVLALVRQVRERDRPVPVLFDVDDLIVDPGLRGQVHGLEGMSEDDLALWWNGVARYRTTLEACDGYIGSTQALCDEVGRLTGLPIIGEVSG